MNLQEGNSSSSLIFDLINTDRWERLLCEEPSTPTKNSSENPVKYLDMPFSWVEKLDITLSGQKISIQKIFVNL